MSAWPDMEQIIGVVLAGGRSSRMGTDKSSLRWQGQRLLDYMIKLLLASGVDRVLVSGNIAGYDCIPDDQPASGPGRALSAVLNHLPAHNWVLVTPVDMPLLTVELLRRLVNNRAGYYVNYPLPALLPTRSSTGEFMQADSIRKLHQLAGSISLDLPPDVDQCLSNLNTPQDWAWAQGTKP